MENYENHNVDITRLNSNITMKLMCGGYEKS